MRDTGHVVIIDPLGYFPRIMRIHRIHTGPGGMIGNVVDERTILFQNVVLKNRILHSTRSATGLCEVFKQRNARDKLSIQRCAEETSYQQCEDNTTKGHWKTPICCYTLTLQTYKIPASRRSLHQNILQLQAGGQSHIAHQFPIRLSRLYPLRSAVEGKGQETPQWIIPGHHCRHIPATAGATGSVVATDRHR